MATASADDDSRQPDMEAVWRAFEAAWYEEPPRRLLADELCAMFPSHPCDKIHALFRPRWLSLFWCDLRIELEELIRAGRPPNWKQLVGEVPELEARARAHFATCGGHEPSDFLAEAAASLNLRDYPGARDAYLKQQILDPRSHKPIERDLTLTGVAGSGGFGIVFEAYDDVLKRRVAVKTLLPRLKDVPGAKERLEREGLILAKLEHPNILPMYNLLRPHPAAGSRAEPAFVMRLLPETLARPNSPGDKIGDPPKVIVRRLQDAIGDFHGQNVAWDDTIERRAAFRQLLRQFVDVCHGVSYAHQRKVIHRDLKPANVIIGPHGETVIIDWGIARVLVDDPVDSDELSRPATTIVDKGFEFNIDEAGTAAYASPEQWKEHPQLNHLAVRQPTDVYALGAMLWEILTGRRPSTSVPHARRFEWFPEKTPYTLQHIVRKATAFDPWNRYLGSQERAWFLARIPGLDKEFPASGTQPSLAETAAAETAAPGGVEQLRRAVQTWLDEEAAEQIAEPLRRAIEAMATEVQDTVRQRDEAERQRGEAERQVVRAQHDVDVLENRARRLRWGTAALTTATIVLTVLVAWGVSQNRQQQSKLRGLELGIEEARKTNQGIILDNSLLVKRNDDLQEQVRDTLRQGADSATLIAEFITDIDSLSSRKKLDALDRLLADLPEIDKSTPDFKRRLFVAVQLGRCKLLHRMERLSEAELAGVAALEGMEGLPAADVTLQDRATKLRLLHELVDIRAARGDVPGMKATVNQALRMYDEIDESTASEPLWLTLKSQSYGKQGYYYEIVGNPWRQSDAYRRALEYAGRANDIANNQETQVHLARIERLTSASISAIADRQLELNGEHNLEAQRLANAAMERTKKHSDGSITSLEIESWALERQASVAYDASELTEAQKLRMKREQTLQALVMLDPDRPRWRLQQIHNDLYRMVTESSASADTSQWESRIDSYQPEIDRLTRQYPENLDLQTKPLEFLRGLALYSHAEKLTGESRSDALKRADDALMRYDAEVSQVAAKAPLVRRFVLLRATTRQYRAGIAQLRGDEPRRQELRLEGVRANREFYEARFDEAPDEPEWLWLAAYHAHLEAAMHIESGRPSDGLERCKYARSLLNRVRAADATVPFPVLLCAQITELESDTEWISKASEQDPCTFDGDSWNRRFAADNEVLHLRRRVFEMVTEPDRHEARSMLDSAFSSVASSVRREAYCRLLSPTRGPYFTQFGTYDAFRREWTKALSEGGSNKKPAKSPFDAAKRDDDSFGNPVPDAFATSLRNWIAVIENGSHLLLTSWFVMDEPVIETYSGRIRRLREPDMSASTEERQLRHVEIEWMLRSISSCLNRIENRGERGRWQNWMQQATESEIARLNPPDGFPWSDDVRRVDDWRRMDYVALARAANTENRLDTWFDFLNAEFAAASRLMRSPPEDPQAPADAGSTWGAFVISRQITDDLFLDTELRTAVINHIVSHEADWKQWNPAFRDALAAVIWLTGDTQQALKIDPEIVKLGESGYHNLAARIAAHAVATRQFASIRADVIRWSQQSEFQDLRTMIAFSAVRTALELEDADAATKVLDTLDAIAGVTGWRFRTQLVASRNLPAAELLMKLGDLPESDPKQDFQAAAIAIYARALRSRSADDVKRLAALADLPHCDDPVWLYELIGDAWSYLDETAQAKAAYQSCLAAFPPHTPDADAASLRVNKKLRSSIE